MQIILGATGFFKFNLINTIPANYQFLIPKKRKTSRSKGPTI
jgi:hypothetical protein